MREKAMRSSSMIRLEDLSKAIADGEMQELPLVVKADVQGSVEAVVDQVGARSIEGERNRLVRRRLTKRIPLSASQGMVCSPKRK